MFHFGQIFLTINLFFLQIMQLLGSIMQQRNSVIGLLVLCLFITFTLIPCGVFANSSNWTEVVSYAGSGTGSGASPPFTINHTEWRIIWEYTPQFEFGSQNDFDFWIIPEENRSDYSRASMAVVSVNHPIEQNGTLYISNVTGTFFIETVPCSSDWSITVEQDVNSVPEFPSWIILPLFLMATFSAIIYKKRLHHQRPKKL